MYEYCLEKNFLDMISLFCSGATGQPVKLEQPFDIREVMRFSKEQEVWELVFFALDKACKEKECIRQEDGGELNISKDEYSEMLKRFFVRTASQVRRHNVLNKFFDAIEEKQIRYCVLKGESLSHLYYNPLLRISGDADILIDESDIEDILSILKSLDYEILPFSSDAHHFSANHPVAGKVEVHISLYPDIVENLWFDNKVLLLEDYRKVKTSEGRMIPTLGITDHFIFINLHFIKHFFINRTNIRQLMDILLYMKFYKEDIDWNRYNALLDYLKYKKFFRQLIGIGVFYFGISPDDLPECQYDMDLMNLILRDMQVGGISEKDESAGNNLLIDFYSKAKWETFREEPPDHKYIRRFLTNWREMLLPKKEKLSSEFSYLKKFPYLYPVALMHRIVRLGISIGRGERRITQYIFQEKDHVYKEVFERRIEIVKKLEMI